MLIAHLADTHLGLRQYGLTWREEDIYERFREAIETAVREGVDAILISGDMFDRARPPIRAIRVALDTLELPYSKGIPVYVILGEHDIPKVRDEPPQVLLRYAKLMGTHKTPDIDFLRVDGKEYVIAGVSHFPSRRKYLDKLRERIVAAASKIGGRKSVLMLHQNIRNVFGFEEGIDLADIPKAFTYVAMGHIHLRKVLKTPEGTTVAYPGSIEILRSDEVRVWEEEGKGYYLVDLSGDEPTVNKVDLDVTPQAVVEADHPSHVPPVEDALRKLLRMLKPGRRGILHVRIRMRADVQADPASQVRELVRRRAGDRVYVRVSVERVAPDLMRTDRQALSTGEMIDEVSIVASVISAPGNPGPTAVKVARNIVKLKNVLAGIETGDVESAVEAILSERDFWRPKVRIADEIPLSSTLLRKSRSRGGLDAFLR